MDAFNGYHIRRKFCATAVVYSDCDASDSGFGSFSTLVGDRFGHWNELEASQGSTFRELKALLYVLQSFPALCRNAKLIGFWMARTLVELFLWELQSLSCRQLL